MSEAKERRSVRRCRLHVRVEYSWDSGRRVANVYNLGAGGVFIRTPDPLAPGTDLDLTIHTPGGLEFIRADGTVVWTNLVGTPQMPPGMGVCFTRIDPLTRSRVQQELQAFV